MKFAVVLCIAISTAFLNAASLTVQQFEHQIWHYTNAERAKENLPPLQYDEGLADLARLHSRNMLNFGFFAHKDHLGDMVDDRKQKHYPQLLVSSIGENLARFFNPEKTYSPAEIVEGWMGSPEHRKNILDKDWTHLGVGVVSYSGQLFATQNFATPVVKLLSPTQKSYSRKQVYDLRFEYMSPHPKEDITCVLLFPDRQMKYKIDEKHYTVGSKPITVTWQDDKTFSVPVDFPSCKGKYYLNFGFRGKYYEQGIKLKAK